MKKLLFGLVTLSILITGCNGKEKVNDSTKFLEQNIALHYFNEGRLLKCYNPNNFDEPAKIITNSFEALRVGDFVFFQYTNYQTENVVTGNAKYCLLK